MRPTSDFLGLLLQPGEMRVVAVDDRRPARLDALKNFRLGVGDGLDRGEKFEMHRLDGGDDRDMRPNEPGQRRNLAGVVHAHFEHRVARAFGAARQRQRHAPVVVVGRGRGVRLAVARQRELQRLLGAGLADRAGDADELWRCCARGPRAPARSAPSSTSGTTSSGASLREHAALVGGDDGKAGAGFQRRLDEIMAVAHILEREERFARRDGAGVDRKTRHGLAAARLAASRPSPSPSPRPSTAAAHATFSRKRRRRPHHGR